MRTAERNGVVTIDTARAMAGRAAHAAKSGKRPLGHGWISCPVCRGTGHGTVFDHARDAPGACSLCHGDPVLRW